LNQIRQAYFDCKNYFGYDGGNFWPQVFLDEDFDRCPILTGNPAGFFQECIRYRYGFFRMASDMYIYVKISSISSKAAYQQGFENRGGQNLFKRHGQSLRHIADRVPKTRGLFGNYVMNQFCNRFRGRTVTM